MPPPDLDPDTDDAKAKRAELLRQAIRRKKAARSEKGAASRGLELPPRPDGQPALLGEMQRGLWLAHQLAPRSPAYNLASAFQVTGKLDPERLRMALGEVFSRHRLLRSNFQTAPETHAPRDAVVQVVHSGAELDFEAFEVEAGRGHTTLLEAAREPFDLATGPLTRLRLIEERSTSTSFLLLVLHHILADERSLALLWDELAAAYAGLSTAPNPRAQYDDWIHWLRQRDPAEHQAALDTWRRRLDPLPEDLDLPFERKSSRRAGTPVEQPGRLLRRTLHGTHLRGVHSLATAVEVTPFTVLSFAFRLLLRRYTEGRRIAFATPASIRSHPATAKMLGYFLNPVVVATDVDEEHTVENALRGFGKILRDALAHASIPYQSLAEELEAPIFQTMFVHQQAAPAPRLGDVRLTPISLDLGASKFDLTLFATEHPPDGDGGDGDGDDDQDGDGGTLEIAVEFRTDRFDEVWMHGLLDHYATLLEHLPRDLARSAAEVPMLADAQRDALCAQARGPRLDLSTKHFLPRQILDQARDAPRDPAVICEGTTISYAELAGDARAIARTLTAAGVETGDRVGIFLERSPRMIAGLLGSLWAGTAYVPLDPSYPPARNHAILEDAEVAAVLTSSASRGLLPAGPGSVLEVDTLANPSPGADPADLSLDLEDDSVAYLLYTSGSTGAPKGVVVTHGNLRASNAARLQAYEAQPRRFLLVPSLAFDSSVAGLYWMLATGGALVIPTVEEAADPRQLVRLVAEEEVDGLLCVPSLYAQMLAIGGERLRALDVAIVAGESCPSRLVDEHFRALPKTRLFNEYGPTEATVWATFHEMTHHDADRPVAIGHPIPGVRLDVLDDHGRLVPTGLPGHAWIAGPTVAHGYWRRPELSAERFVTRSTSADGSLETERLYRTGDRMAWTPDGRLLFLGREDGQIKLRGFRIEPGEIEASLLEMPGVEQAAVVARPPGAEARLVAFVETSEAAFSKDSFSESWRQALADHLPAHMIPSRWVGLTELPRLPNGKIDRHRLRDLELEPLDIEPSAARPERVPSTSEQMLLSLWEGLLGRSVGLDENFFELGGHSLLVVEMTLAIERDFEISLATSEVFENPTVETLARHLAQRSAQQAARDGGSSATPYRHLFPIQTSGRGRPLVVAVPHFFTRMLAERFRGERPVYGLRGVSLRQEGNRGRWPTMEALGAELADEIERRFPGETCLLAGYSFGASMALEAARVLEARDTPAHGLYLIAPMPFDLYRVGPLSIQLDALRRPVQELSTWQALRLYAKANNPLTRRPYERAWRRLAIEPWRRLACLGGSFRQALGKPLTPRILHADVRVERFRLHAHYHPGPVRTPTVFFNAKEPETDAAATWRPYFEGPLSVVETPDPHLGDAAAEAARQVILQHLQDLED